MPADKILVICGPTATGKTVLALKLARIFNGEIISVDSRQVYKGMDIGTGKDLLKEFKVQSFLRLNSGQANLKEHKKSINYYTDGKIKLWGYDLVNPDQEFSVAEFVKFTVPLFQDLWQQNKLPVIAGGTGLYLKALFEPLELIQIPPNKTLRQKLYKLTVLELQKELIKTNQSHWEQMNNSDRQNPRRLVRAIEIALWKNKYPVARNLNRGNDIEDKNVLLIGLNASKEELVRRINKRVKMRVSLGIVKEIKQLLEKGYSWQLPSMSGLGYKEWREYFESGKGNSSATSGARSDKEEFTGIIEKWKKDEFNYAKRQLTWFKKQKNIIWFDITKHDYQNAVISMVKKWYTNTS